MNVARTLFGGAMSGALVLSACQTAPPTDARQTPVSAVSDAVHAHSLQTVQEIHPVDTRIIASPG